MSDTQQDSVAVLRQMVAEMVNFADVADRCELTEGNAPAAIRSWSERLTALQSQQVASADRGEVARPSQEWYRGRIMETLDDEPGVIGGGFVAGWFRCSNPERGHLHPTDPVGPCPECVAEGSGNWSCISAAVPLPAGSVATPPSPAAPPVRHSCETDRLSECPGCDADETAAIAIEYPPATKRVIVDYNYNGDPVFGEVSVESAAPSGVSDADAKRAIEARNHYLQNSNGGDAVGAMRAALESWHQPQPGRVEGIPLDDETRDILGRPNFTLIHIANALRKSGMTIEPRAEAEQAACLHWMLNLYLQHGAGWRAAAQAHLEAAPTASSQEADHGSL